MIQEPEVNASGSCSVCEGQMFRREKFSLDK